MIQPANRVTEIQEYYFSRKLKEVAKLNAEGKDIISLAIGSPDMPPSKQTIDKLCEVANNPNAHGYQPTVGIPELRKAMAGFYKRWYDVDLDWATEIQPLIGSKEGILHVTLAFCNPGDEVLIPNPGYPTYTAINKILGTKITYYDLREDNGWQPDFDALEKMDLSHVKLMWTNYPKVKSNIDNGSFRGIQLAAAEAMLNNTDEWHRENNIQNYRRRRDIAEEIMKVLHCQFDPNQVGMFLWGKIPEKYADVEDLTEKILHEARVFITPGFIFGSNGKRYIRISLCAKDEKMKEALERIKKVFDK